MRQLRRAGNVGRIIIIIRRTRPFREAPRITVQRYIFRYGRTFLATPRANRDAVIINNRN